MPAIQAGRVVIVYDTHAKAVSKPEKTVSEYNSTRKSLPQMQGDPAVTALVTQGRILGWGYRFSELTARTSWEGGNAPAFAAAGARYACPFLTCSLQPCRFSLTPTLL